MLDDTCGDHLKGLSTTATNCFARGRDLHPTDHSSCTQIITPNDRAVALVDAKRAAQGTPLEMDRCGVSRLHRSDRSENARAQAVIRAVLEEGERSNETRSSG